MGLWVAFAVPLVAFFAVLINAANRERTWLRS